MHLAYHLIISIRKVRFCTVFRKILILKSTLKKWHYPSMNIKENIAKLNQASNLDEARAILVDSPDELAERVWREIEKRRSD